MDAPPNYNNDDDDCMYDDYDEYVRTYDSDDIQSLMERSVCLIYNRQFVMYDK